MKPKQFSKDYSLATTVCKIFDENKAENVLLIDVSYISNIADYFVIATANSTVHARALADKVEEGLNSAGEKVLRRDGATEKSGDSRWLVLDFGTVIVHIFTPEIREFYHLEKMWNDGKNTLNMAGVNKLIEQASSKKNAEKSESDSNKKESKVATGKVERTEDNFEQDKLQPNEK